MSQHPNARLTPRGGETLVSRIESGVGVSETARQMGVSSQTASKWLARAGLPGLADVDRVTGEVRCRGPVTLVRYERKRPGELVHVDVKRVARPRRGGKKSI